MPGPADPVPPPASRGRPDRLDRTPVRARTFHFPDGDLATSPASRDRTLVVLAGAVDDTGEGTRLVQVVDHLAVAGHAHALLLVGAEGPEAQVEVWRLRVQADRAAWAVEAAGCPAAGWPRSDHLLVAAVGLPEGVAVHAPSGPPGLAGPVEVVVRLVGGDPVGLVVREDPGRALGRLLAATGWDVTAPHEVAPAPGGRVQVEVQALDDLLLDGSTHGLAGLSGPWARTLAGCAGAEVLRWRVDAVQVVDCGPGGLLRLGPETVPDVDGRVRVAVSWVTRVEAFALAAARLTGQPDGSDPLARPGRPG